MDTLRCYWDVFFNAYGSLLMKTVLVLLLVWWCHQTLQRFRKEAPDATGPIAEANARERYQWRYLRWALSSIQGILSLYIIGLIITTLLRSGYGFCPEDVSGSLCI